LSPPYIINVFTSETDLKPVKTFIGPIVEKKVNNFMKETDKNMLIFSLEKQVIFYRRNW
jgi:hypothetical protein